jgi:hypothetical protein
MIKAIELFSIHHTVNSKALAQNFDRELSQSALSGCTHQIQK